MKIDKKSLTKPVKVEDLQRHRGLQSFLRNVRKGDEVWEWKSTPLFSLGTAGGFVIVRNGEPTEHVYQSYTG